MELIDILHLTVGLFMLGAIISSVCAFYVYEEFEPMSVKITLALLVLTLILIIGAAVVVDFIRDTS